MSYAMVTGISQDQIESMKELWEVVASMPDRQMVRHIEHLRKIAILLEIDADDFFEYTGGHYLYDYEEA